MANGAKIEFLKVGGRTSAIVPSVQKKTGKVAGDVKTKEKDNSNDDDDDDDDDNDNDDDDAEDESGKNPIPTPKKPKTPSKKPSKPKTKPETKPKEPKPEPSSTEKKKPTPEPTSSTLPHRRSQKASRAKPDDPLSSHLTDIKTTTADHDNAPPVSSKKRTATGAKIEADASHETPASKKAKDGHAQPGRRRSARVSGRG